MFCESISPDCNAIYNNVVYQDSRFLRNSEIKDFLVEAIKPELNEYLKLFDLSETSNICKDIPIFISEKLTSPINVVVTFPYQRAPNHAILGIVNFYLKVSNVENFSTLLDMFSTNKFTNCTQNIQIIKYFARERDDFFSTNIS